MELPVDTAARKALEARRDQALAVLRQLKPTSVMTQIIILGFALGVILLPLLASLVRPSLNPFPYLVGPLIFMVSWLFASSVRVQRRLNALSELVLQNYR